MTTSERNIADRLASVDASYPRDRVFIAQLKTWHDRPMTGPGIAKMLRLLDRYQKQIPDSQQLRSACVNEQLSRLAP